MSLKVESLKDLYSLIVSNPEMAKALKSDPEAVAKLFGFSLTEQEIKNIKSHLDVDRVKKMARELDSWAAKSASPLGEAEDL